MYSAQLAFSSFSLRFSFNFTFLQFQTLVLDSRSLYTSIDFSEILKNIAGPGNQLQPATYGGHSKVNDAGFVTATYQSRCLPIVTRSSIIVAVCGPDDKANNASPKKEGWFYSDFYMMHHLFRNTASTQYWLTCVSPEQYVEKYARLLHGDATKDRKVVLDASMLEDKKDITTVSAKILAERFLATVADASKQTKGTDRQILVMMFGHGWEDVYSIVIGGPAEDLAQAISPQILQQALIRHNPRPQATILSTSCFGEGWCFARSGNTSNIHGGNDATQLRSWPASDSIRQYAGSKFAASVAEALVRTELLGESEENPMATPTFATLTKAISDILVKEVDNSTVADHPSFAAQDDLWGEDSRSKSGFPLSTFKERYDSLQIASQGQTWADLGVTSTRSAGGLHSFESMGGISKTLEESKSVKLNRFLQLPIGEA